MGKDDKNVEVLIVDDVVNGKAGQYEFILDAAGEIVHRLFVPY